jgi:hypothetical protein
LYNHRVTDFVELCRTARERPGPETRDRLWAAWCALPVWHMISAPSPVGPLPFSNFIHGQQRCVLAFTTVAAADVYARTMGVGPLMSGAPEATIHRVPQLKQYGVVGFLVDIGPDGFHTTLDLLSWMFYRFRAPPAPAPSSPMATSAPMLSLESLLSLPAWHLRVSKADPTMPDLAAHGGDLVAQVYSSSQVAARLASGAPTMAIPPAHALTLLVDMELVKLVRFDDQLMVDVLDLKLRTRSSL